MTGPIDYEALRREALLWDDYDLDEQLAIAEARRRVAQRHGRLSLVDLWVRAVEVYADVRRERAQLAEALTDAVLGISNNIDLGRLDEP